MPFVSVAVILTLPLVSATTLPFDTVAIFLLEVDQVFTVPLVTFKILVCADFRVTFVAEILGVFTTGLVGCGLVGSVGFVGSSILVVFGIAFAKVSTSIILLSTADLIE